MAKYEKTNYCIIGRYPNGSKYGITTKVEVSGYTVEDLEDIAICKRGGWWFVDHIPTGLGVVTVGCKTRDAALEEYKNYFQVKVNGMKDTLRNAVEAFEKAPLESDVEKWESVNFCTTYDWRFDKVTAAANRAGLVIKKADENTYLHGGNIDIIGSPEDLEKIREVIAKYEQKDTERAEIILFEEGQPENKVEEAAADTEQQEPAKDPKAAHGPVPEKTFIGEMIQGNGWMILFDKAVERTRIIFNEKPEKKILKAVKEAGFYWSPSMNSWNKKLTFKAYRAAKKLSEELTKLYAA